MNYAVFGPREGRTKGAIFDDAELIARWLGTIVDISLLISGGGRGVETLAEAWARRNNVKFKLIRPQFSGTDEGAISVKIAFDSRNMTILRESDRVIVFWDGRFKDMIDIIKTATAMQKPVVIFPM
jgi:hypothetical protein